MDDGNSPGRFDSDDEIGFEHAKLDIKFEEAGALDMSTTQDDLLLSRMPKFTWEALSKLKDDDEVRIGTLRMQGDRENPTKLSLMLDTKFSQSELVPREYNLHVQSKDQANTFVFTERDLPGYSRKVAGQGTEASKALSVDKKETPHLRNYRMPGYQKAIPKKTALIGHVKAEYSCLPVENNEYVSILRERMAEMPDKDMAPLNLGVQTGNMQTGGSSFTSFIKTAPTNQKKQQQKAARMPRNDLLDILFQCFKEYKYWHLKDLRVRTMQPESYLREVLDTIAELIRSGSRANTWHLKSTGQDGGHDSTEFASAQEEVAPSRADPEELSDDEDDDNVKMEDVT